MDDQPKFDQWCIVEVMGHSRFAGRVTEQAVGGCSFIRVDVPECDGRSAFTKLLGGGSIFALTPCTEQVARAAGRSFRARPYEFFELPMLPTTVHDVPEDDETDED